MKFSFDVGTEESHKVEFSFSRWWGTTSIRVDGEIVLKYLTLLYGWIGFLLGAVFYVLSIISFAFDFPFLTMGLIYGVTSLTFMGSLLMFTPMIISYIIYRKRFPVSFTVGENEKHTVQIDPKWPRLGLGGGAFRKTEYFIYIDNELFWVKRR